MKSRIRKIVRPIALPAYLGLWRIFHAGNNFECNICGKSYSKFAPYGVKRRPNAMCPNCESVERHRLQWYFMKKNTNLNDRELNVLHFAPEKGIKNNLMVMKNIKYVTTDLFDESTMLQTDITNMPFKEGTFDVVLCNHVLEHIIDDIKAMNELYRILKKDGWAILQVPIDYNKSRTYEDATIISPDQRLKYFMQKDHVRIYGKDYSERLKSVGFKLEVLDVAKKLDKKFIKKHILDKDELIYFVRK